MNSGDVVGALLAFTIVFLVFGFAAFKRYLKHKESLPEKQSTVEAEKLETKLMNQEKTIQGLQKRVEALESIIVRDEYELNQKFKAL